MCAHIPAVKRIARGYAGYGLPHEDLVQEGCLGLISATRRFDQSLGVPLMAYADCWIRASMQEYLLRNWCIVKIATTKSRRKLFYRLRSAKPRLEWMSQSEVQTIAAALDVSEDDVSEMERALYGRDVAFDLSSDKESNTLPPSAYLEHCCDGPDAQVMQQESSNEEFRLLSKAIGRLDDRSREIVEQRWLQEGTCRPTLDTLAHQFAISAERVRQIEAEALRRLRSEFRSYLATRA